MSKDTNYQQVVIAHLKQMTDSSASSASSNLIGATEQTALDILAALTQINTTLSTSTNTLLTEIRDSNVAQEALITASNTLLTDIRTDLAALNSTGQITNGQLVDVNQELDAIEVSLNSIEAADATFYADLLTSQNDIQTLLTGVITEVSGVTTTLLQNQSRLDTLISQTDQLESLLGNINTTLQNNSTVNAAALEQLRLLLVDIDANTDDVEAQLITVIAEHDQTQVLLTNLIAAMATNTIAINDVEATLTGTTRTIDAVEATTDGTTDPDVQSVSLLFRGNNGTLNGVTVRNNFSFSYTPNKGEDLVGSIPFTVPNTGEQRIIITYVR